MVLQSHVKRNAARRKASESNVVKFFDGDIEVSFREDPRHINVYVRRFCGKIEVHKFQRLKRSWEDIGGKPPPFCDADCRRVPCEQHKFVNERGASTLSLRDVREQTLMLKAAFEGALKCIDADGRSKHMSIPMLDHVDAAVREGALKSIMDDDHSKHISLCTLDHVDAAVREVIGKCNARWKVNCALERGDVDRTNPSHSYKVPCFVHKQCMAALSFYVSKAFINHALPAVRDSDKIVRGVECDELFIELVKRNASFFASAVCAHFKIPTRLDKGWHFSNNSDITEGEFDSNYDIVAKSVVTNTGNTRSNAESSEYIMRLFVQNNSRFSEMDPLVLCHMIKERARSLLQWEPSALFEKWVYFRSRANGNGARCLLNEISLLTGSTLIIPIELAVLHREAEIPYPDQLKGQLKSIALGERTVTTGDVSRESAVNNVIEHGEFGVYRSKQLTHLNAASAVISKKLVDGIDDGSRDVWITVEGTLDGSPDIIATKFTDLIYRSFKVSNARSSCAMEPSEFSHMSVDETLLHEQHPVVPELDSSQPECEESLVALSGVVQHILTVRNDDRVTLPLKKKSLRCHDLDDLDAYDTRGTWNPLFSGIESDPSLRGGPVSSKAYVANIIHAINKQINEDPNLIFLVRQKPDQSQMDVAWRERRNRMQDECR